LIFPELDLLNVTVLSRHWQQGKEKHPLSIISHSRRKSTNRRTYSNIKNV